jgi:hypothetical protein
MKSEILVASMALLGLIFLSGCAFNHRQFPKEEGPLKGPDDFIVQIDDYGQFWDNEEPERALAHVRKLSKDSNVIVVVFVHGWHHNAAPADKNLRDFATSVEEIRKLLTDSTDPESEVYRTSRKHLTGTEALTVVPIYIGWRGKALPGILDNLTFWNRKATAERVGQGDLREFLVRLNAIYKERRNLRASGQARNFLGMTSFGHSFGGQVLLSAVAGEIEGELINKSVSLDGLPGAQPVVDLSGFGDLVVLVNPALEAMQFERIWRLSNNLNFGQRQSPVLLTVSSAGDVPRQLLFPIGRNLDALNGPGFRPLQRPLWTQALGEFRPFLTHDLDVVLPHSSTTPAFDPKLYVTNPCAIANIDISNNPIISGIRLTPTSFHRTNNPFLVANASTEVILNHSKVFENLLRKFLNDYVAIVEGKRLVAAGTPVTCAEKEVGNSGASLYSE